MNRVHRVQRVPQTESQGRVHASASTVAILLYLMIELNINQVICVLMFIVPVVLVDSTSTQPILRFESHIPTGTVVTCQIIPAQEQAKAIEVLRARILKSNKKRSGYLKIDVHKLVQEIVLSEYTYIATES